jgi:hypothetical protein
MAGAGRAGRAVVEGLVKKKLIKVALPLEAINKAAPLVKAIRHAHPSTLHPYRLGAGDMERFFGSDELRKVAKRARQQGLGATNGLGCVWHDSRRL